LRIRTSAAQEREKEPPLARNAEREDGVRCDLPQQINRYGELYLEMPAVLLDDKLEQNHPDNVGVRECSPPRI